MNTRSLSKYRTEASYANSVWGSSKAVKHKKRAVNGERRAIRRATKQAIRKDFE
jgi:hypothetical protein